MHNDSFHFAPMAQYKLHIFPIITVTELATETRNISKGSTRDEDKSEKIHSIALRTSAGATSTIAGHQQTLALLHDHKDTVLDPNLVCDVIEPALEIERVDAEQLRMNRIKGDKSKPVPTLASSTKKSTTTSSMSKVASKSAKKTTSAAAFFKSETKPAVKKSKAKVATKESTSSTKKVTKLTEEKKTAAPKKKEFPKKAAPVAKKHKGNADDFVGDVDEDDDFLVEEEERKKRLAESEAKVTKAKKLREKSKENQETRKPMPRDDDDEDMVDVSEEKDDGITGAMDVFASKTKPKRASQNEENGSVKKKRKQVLVEKTFIDDSGFFRTETVTEWQDVEEEEKPKTSSSSSTQASTAKKVKPKNTKGMKQQGLVGFFKKK